MTTTDKDDPGYGGRYGLQRLPRDPAQGQDTEETTYDRANSVPVAWIAFAGNGNIRLWTSDPGRAKEEKAGGLDMRAFTLAELVAPVSRMPAGPPCAQSGQKDADESDVRWAVNVLLETIAAKFEAWDTMDLWRSDAASTVRSFKHDLSSVPSPGDAVDMESTCDNCGAFAMRFEATDIENQKLRMGAAEIAFAVGWTDLKGKSVLEMVKDLRNVGACRVCTL